MNFFKTFQQQSKFFLFFMVFLAAVNSLLFSGVLVFINNAITQRPLPFLPQYDWLIFIVLLAASMLLNAIFETFIIKLTNSIIYDLEITIIQNLRMASYQVYEQFGADRVYTAISDTRILAGLPEAFINFINAAILVVCVMAYLFYISLKGGACILALMVSLLIFYLVRNRSIEKDMNEVRDLQDDYHQYLRDLLLGFREIKMSRRRNENLFNKFLNSNRLAVKRLGIETSVKYMANELVGKYSWYIVLGIIIFVFPRLLGLKINDIAAFLVTILYLIGPVATLIMIFPTYTRSKIALERIKQLHDEVGMKVEEGNAVSGNGKEVWENGDRAGGMEAMDSHGVEFDSISFEDVVYEYKNDDLNNSFRLGPINLRINKGEIVFITGGNGSGKSTFINILTGLYQPGAGRICVNDRPLSDGDLAFFSTRISAIFTDNYLFSENYDDFELTPSNKILEEYIDLLRLPGILQFKEDKNTIDHRLSKGQRKRMAMIYALLETRDIVILDEWAAEQDPEFRAYFYEELIPRLKEMGKTIIAVTHDDHFFACAERLIKFDYGMVDKDKKILQPA